MRNTTVLYLVLLLLVGISTASNRKIRNNLRKAVFQSQVEQDLEAAASSNYYGGAASGGWNSYGSNGYDYNYNTFSDSNRHGGHGRRRHNNGAGDQGSVITVELDSSIWRR